MYLTEQYDYKKVLFFFEELSKIPRGSGNTKAVSDYVACFAREHGLKVVQDDSNNVIVYLPATAGFEGKQKIMLQGHLDMVCEKETDCAHDFLSDPLELYIDNGKLAAKGTTLGGDDGIAIAYMMALIDDKEAAHPEMELLMTTDEETGMYGAHDLDKSLLSAKYLINIDSEEEGYCFAGCAGGLRQDITLPVKKNEIFGNGYTIKLNGLLGGHSGVEIHKNRLNANKTMARILFALRDKADYYLLDIQGGKLDNAITRDCTAKIVSDLEEDEMKALVAEIAKVLLAESGSYEPQMSLSCEKYSTGTFSCLDPVSFEKLLYILVQAPYGVQRMSADIAGLVESSLNMGVVRLNEDTATIRFSLRSSVTSYKRYMSDKLTYLAEMMGASSATEGEYPAWEYRKDSFLRDSYVKLFESEYGKKPNVCVMHAGLECGLLSDALPDLDIISIGPDMSDVHTPAERLDIDSAVRVYRFLEKLICML